MPVSRKVAIMVACYHLVAAASAAQGLSVPSIVRRGLDAYRSGGADAAVRAWLANSPLAHDSGAANSVSFLHRLEQLYGPVIGDDVLKVNAIGTHVVRAYVVLLYEKGPVYMWFECYQTPRAQWLISAFLFNARPDAILPPSLIDH